MANSPKKFKLSPRMPSLPNLEFETKYWNQGLTSVVGVDEVGRGAWAGPVVVGAVVFSPDSRIPEGINDSKLLTQSKREYLSEKIKECASSFALGIIDVPLINTVGIGKATSVAMLQAVRNLTVAPEFHLIDAFYIPGIRRSLQHPIIQGDRKSISIAAASIIAKVFRDNLMRDLATQFPEYLFGQHKGYGTRTHRQLIKDHGFCELHRSSFDIGYLLDD